MAGDWIPIRCDLRDDPAVIRMAVELRGALLISDLDENAVVGMLHRAWAWASSVSKDGRVAVSAGWLDSYVGVDGFCDALERVGWLTIDTDGLMFPHFDRWMSQGAKRRLMDAQRQREHRERKRHADVTKMSHESDVTQMSQECHTNVTQMSQLSDKAPRVPEADTPNIASLCDETVTREEKRREENTSSSPAARAYRTVRQTTHNGEGGEGFEAERPNGNGNSIERLLADLGVSVRMAQRLAERPGVTLAIVQHVAAEFTSAGYGKVGWIVNELEDAGALRAHAEAVHREAAERAASVAAVQRKIADVLEQLAWDDNDQWDALAEFQAIPADRLDEMFGRALSRASSRTVPPDAAELPTWRHYAVTEWRKESET